MTYRRAVLVLLLPLAIGCGHDGATMSTVAPTAPSPLAIAPNPLVDGVVFVTTAQGRRRVAGARVIVMDLIEGPYGNYPWYDVTADANGRFVASFFNGSTVKVTAFAPGDNGPLSAQSLVQVCARHTTVRGDTTVNIELSSMGSQPDDWHSPLLSGTVFEETSQARRPLANVGVLYSSYGHDGADVYTRTDAAGRYAFCGLAIGPGSLVTGCRESQLPPDRRPKIIKTEMRGDTGVDINCSGSF